MNNLVIIHMLLGCFVSNGVVGLYDIILSYVVQPKVAEKFRWIKASLKALASYGIREDGAAALAVMVV